MAMGLPVSTPPNAIAYASGELAARDFSLAGTLLGVLAAVLIGTLGGPIIGFWMAM
jgi:sodium-dependent dicarboxylate transporter 2/3/5